MKKKNAVIFFNQLYPLIKNGIVLSEAIEIIKKQKQTEILKKIIDKIDRDIKSGSSLSKALEKHPNIFSNMDCALVRAGEETGKLSELTGKLIYYQKQIENTKQKINKALFYPAIVFLISLLITIGLLVFIVPQFQEVFSSFNAPLPWLTQNVIKLSDFLQQSGWIVFIFLLVLVFSIYFSSQKSKKIQYFFQCILLKIPLIGKLLWETNTSLYCTILSTTYQSGIPLIDGIELAKKGTTLLLIKEKLSRCQAALSDGDCFSSTWKKQKLIDNNGLALLIVGESSGQLGFMLDSLSTHYAEKTQHFVDYLSKLIEPTIMILLAVIAGGLIIAMYLPIFNISAAIK